MRSPLAANLFRQLATQWPESPYAPKALLAAQLLDPEDGAFAQARLDSLYPASPYVAMLRGEDAPGYQVLEDSLQAFAQRNRRRRRGLVPVAALPPATTPDRLGRAPASPGRAAGRREAVRPARPRAVSAAATELSRTVFGRQFQNPLLLAAGTAGFGRELAGVMELDRLGGIVTKAVSLAPRAGNRAPRVAEFRGGMLNSVGLANPGLERVRTDYLPWLATHVRGPRCW